MNVIVHERDSEHLSQEARALGIQAWDVIQNGQLVGIFRSEEEADAYRQVLEEAQPHS
ncbi:hypothetical protein [Pseudomonas sp. LRF_L74]|uniref:hypothetical protein n=1 Tax=Pseudomonas sp. LRF_L74 TaxID=3369422 RepID=UPI003F5DA345